MSPCKEVVTEIPTPETLARRKRKRAAKARAFIKGPLPVPWLKRARALGLPALSVALALFYRRGMTKSGQPIVLSGSTLDALGVPPRSVWRGLEALEGDGLVRTDRHRGRNPRVWVLGLGDNGGSE